MKKLSKEAQKSIKEVVQHLSALEDVLQDEIDSAQEYLDKRGEPWQEKNKDEYEQFIAMIQDLRDNTEDLKDSLDEAGDSLVFVAEDSSDKRVPR